MPSEPSIIDWFQSWPPRGFEWSPEYLAVLENIMMYRKFQPTSDRVLFERIPHPAPKKGELIIPRPPSQEARIIAVGKKCQHLKAGQRVIIPLSVAGITLNGVIGKLCLESQVEAILT
jgi:co-chaperonin GroES (HSP10)